MTSRAHTPREQVTGVLDDPERVAEIVEALRSAGIAEGDLEVYGGEDALAMVDPDGRQHGVAGRVTRALERFGQEGEEHRAAAEELQEGHLLVAVTVSDAEGKDQAAEALRAQGVHRLRFWGRWSVELMSE